MSDELITALERTLQTLDAITVDDESRADAARIRAHIADLKAGAICDTEPEKEADATVNSPRLNVMYDDGPAERAKVVAYIERYPTNDYAIGLAVRDLAKAIVSGAHMEANNAD